MKAHPFLEDYASEDRAYITSHKNASDGVKSGEFKSYCVSHDTQRGRCIDVETEQGWTEIYSDYMQFEYQEQTI